MSMTMLLLATAAFAGGGTAQASDRQTAIWSYAQQRMDQQLDVWFEAGDYPKAIQVLKVETTAFPSDYEVATHLGWMQENVQDYPAAIKSYEAYFKNNPKDPDAPFPLAHLYYRQKQYDQVPSLLEPTMKRTPPPHANAFRILAHSYEKTNRLSDSRRIWQAYIKVAPKDDTAKMNLRRVERKLAEQG
jgi:tetratricopeptide (TPR) repeat protein